MSEFFRRLRYLLQHRRLQRELEQDMEFHREMAAREGRTNFGNILRLKEDARQAWGWMWIDRLAQDVRYAARVLLGAPGFTLTAVSVLAIGIGVNVTAFSLFDLIALKPLPVRDPESLVRLQPRSPEHIASEMPYPFVVFYQRHARTLQASMAVMGGVPPLHLNDDIAPVTASFVSTNYFAELGTRAGVGRLLHPGWDDKTPVVVLSYSCWQSRFGGDPAIAGKLIHLNRKAATIIGVTPYAFASLGDQHSDVWLPLPEQPYFIEGSHVLEDPSNGSVQMWGRLAPGATRKTAAQELLLLTNELRKIYPKAVWDKQYIQVDPGGHSKVMDPEMYQVAAMVEGLVLLILAVACGNLSGMMMARGIARQREIGIRLAIGASWQRVFRQLFTEALLLALLGAGLGVALSWAVIGVAMRQLDAPGWMSASPDWRVLAAALATALISAMLSGLAPALQIARQRYRRMLARHFLTAGQVAASCTLLIVAGLLVHAVHRVLFTDPGFGYAQVLGIDPGLGAHGYSDAAAQNYLNTLTSRVRSLPGVERVALSKIPLLKHGVTSYMTVDFYGRPVNIYPNWVDGEFFRTMEIPLLRGRVFSPGETNAAIVSQSFASKEWPGQDALGKPLWRDGSGKDRIIGIVRNARIKAMNDGDAVEVYWPPQAADMPAMTLLVKTAGAPDGIETVIRSIAEKLGPKLFPSVWLLKSGFHETALDIEKLALVVSLLGAVGLCISAIGVAGLVGYSVSQRRKEIAIRLALGAHDAQALSAIFRQFAWPLVIGVSSGTALAALLSGLLEKTLYGVGRLDPASYAAGIAVLLAASLTAGFVPARRVLKLNLSKALNTY